MKHPSKRIIGSKGSELSGKKIICCITGSVAAFKCPEIVRELMRHGAEVYVFMTEASTKIIHPYLMEWATGNPVVTELTGRIEHVSFFNEKLGSVDLILVAPATANTISKVACGISDTPVTALISAALGANVPVVMVPAMHTLLYRNKIFQRNMEKVRGMGVEFINPRMEEEKAKIAETEIIVEKVIGKLSKKDMENLNLLITAGPTREKLDSVRFLTNPSSGKMGLALAEEAINRGASVTLVYGPGTQKPPPNVKVVEVVTTEEMLNAVVSELNSKRYHLVILAAAPLDFKFEKEFSGKISSETGFLEVKLVPSPKIWKEIRKYGKDCFFIGFKAEYNVSREKLIEKAYKRLKEAGMNLIIANDVGRKGIGFSSNYNEVFLIDEEGRVKHVPFKPKREVAKEILDLAVEKLKLKRG